MPAPRKTKVIGIRVTPALAGVLRLRAREEGASLSEWLRELAVREVAEQMAREVGAELKSAA